MVVSLLVHTGVRRYIIPQGDVFAIRAVNTAAEIQNPALVTVDLGAFIDPNDRSEQPPRHGLFVPLRRKQIVLLVSKVDMLEQPLSHHPLPQLMRDNLKQPWAVGVYGLEHDLVVQLDLRAVARSVLLTSAH